MHMVTLRALVVRVVYEQRPHDQSETQLAPIRANLYGAEARNSLYRAEPPLVSPSAILALRAALPKRQGNTGIRSSIDHCAYIFPKSDQWMKV